MRDGHISASLPHLSQPGEWETITERDCDHALSEIYPAMKSRTAATERCMTAAEVAKYLKVQLSSVYKLVRMSALRRPYPRGKSSSGPSTVAGRKAFER
jgi:hypothetical protein